MAADPVHTTLETTPPDTRDRLLDAAETLFSASGYDGVGVREIVDAAGVNIAAVSYHFGSKRDLYVETVRRALERSAGEAKWRALECDRSDTRSAACALALFIRVFLHDVVGKSEPGAACSLIIREASEPSGAVDSILHNFFEPNQRRLTELLAVLDPSADTHALRLTAESIFGQVLHYRVFRTFFQFTWTNELSDAAELDCIAAHIGRFSLTALGCDAAVIDDAITKARAADLETPSRVPERNGE